MIPVFAIKVPVKDTLLRMLGVLIELKVQLRRDVMT